VILVNRTPAGKIRINMVNLPIQKNTVKGKIIVSEMGTVTGKSIWLLFFALLFYSGCWKDKKSAQVLSKEQMVNALAKIYICEQKIYKLALGSDSSQEVFTKLKGRVFKEIGTSDSVFRKSYDYYMDRPQDLEQIYSALVDTLNLYEQRGNITPTAPTPRQNPR
jgi:hypothetical protein